ncbi:MAG: OmpA family protein, partial [Terricaulis sp.]
GVTSIDASGLSLGAVERPYNWSVRLEETRVVLAGAAPTDAAVAALTAVAARTFPNREIVNQMHVAGGAPSPDFRDVARAAIERLGGLSSGQARFVDTQIVFIGDGSQAGVDALKRAFAAPRAPFKARIDVTIDGLDPEHPELQGLDLASGDPEDCAQGFARMMEQNVINFATGSAMIDPSSRRILDSLVSVAVRCDRFSIEVAGYTDNEGVRAANMELSAARANAVADYFAAHGVARERLNARGYGPDRPRASNANEDGRAANRRIEFNVNG